jgi:hypothetical protein
VGNGWCGINAGHQNSVRLRFSGPGVHSSNAINLKMAFKFGLIVPRTLLALPDDVSE